MDIKYAYYNTSKGYRVLGGTAVHFLKADGSLDGTEYIDKTSFQDIAGTKSFYTSGGNNYDNNSLHIASSDGSDPAITFNKIGTIAGQIKMNVAGYHFLNPGLGYYPVNAAGYIKSGSDDSYVLLGGGGHMPVSSFNSSNYVDYIDNREISPSEISPLQLGYGFTAWDNNNTGPWADFLHFGSYTDASGGEQNLILFKKNGFGIRQYQGNWQDSSPYTAHVDYWHSGHFSNIDIANWNAAFNSQGNFVTLNTQQIINARKEIKGATGNRYDEAAFEVWGDGSNIYPTLGFHQPGSYAGTISMRNSNQFYFRDTSDVDFVYLNSKGYIKSGSDDSYMLLGGGGHLLTSSKANALENGTGIGFSAGVYPTDIGNEYPYIYHGNSGSNTPFVPLATQGFVTSRTNNKDGAWIQSARNFPEGTLIKTNIDYSQTNGSAFLVEIKANMYGAGAIPMDAKVEGYIYNDTIINTIGYSTNPNLGEVTALNLNGELCFWFPSMGYWHGFTVKVTDVTGGNTTTVNRAYAIENVADPGGTKRVSIWIRTIATRDWVNNQGFATNLSLNNYLTSRGSWNTASIAQTDYPNSVTVYAGDPITTGFNSYYGTSLHIKGDYSWYNRLDFSTSGDRIDLWQGINVSDMSYRGQLPIIPYGVTNWTSNNFNPDNKVNKSGDTMTGILNFANNLGGIKGTMADNDFWRVGGGNNGSNFGFLELAVGDDGNEEVVVSQYTGEFTSLLRRAKLLDASGNTTFPQNVTAGNAINAGSDSQISGRIFGRRELIDATGLNEDTYYPVVINMPVNYPTRIKVYRTLDGSFGVPSYSLHGGGFWCYYEFDDYGNGWGVTDYFSVCNYQQYSWTNTDPIGYSILNLSSKSVVWVRGGSKYWFDVNATTDIVLYPTGYTSVSGEIANPMTSRPWINVNKNITSKDLLPYATTAQLNNYIPLTGTGDFTGTITSPDGNVSFGNDSYYKAKLYLYDYDNPNFPNQTLLFTVNTEEGVYIDKSNPVEGLFTSFAIGSSTINFNAQEAGVFTNLEISNAGLFGNYKIPTQDGSYIQRKYVTDNFMTPTQVTDYIPTYNNWNGSTFINQRKVIGEIAWRNYGNGHTIFDISSGTAPWGTSKSNVDAEIPWQNSFPTIVGGNGSQTYGVRVDRARLADGVVGYDLSTFATQTWVNTNFIPKTHPVYNITQANINSWNAAASGSSHTHSNLSYLNNIDQWLGVGQAPRFNSVFLMDAFGYGQLVLGEGNIGGESGLVDISNKRFYAGRINEYLKYGSSIDGFEGLNIHFDAQLLGIGRELGNHEDKVQIAGDLSVDTIDINHNSRQLILNPLYNTDGDVRHSRNAHIYIVTRNAVSLPDKPILGQRIEIFNDSDSDIEVTHSNVGTMFKIPGFCKVTGIAANKGFRFDAEPVYTKQYDI